MIFSSGKHQSIRRSSPWGIQRGGFESPTNRPNRILAAFRKLEDARNVYAVRQWANFLTAGWDFTICLATPAEIRHARTVLNRLAPLMKES